jgi:KTSC domain
MAQLNSTNLASADYDADTQSLVIMFKSGTAYTYSDVPETIYDGLLSAPRPGVYFRDEIKGIFSYTKG